MTTTKEHEVEILPLKDQKFDFLVKCKTCAFEARTITRTGAESAKINHINYRLATGD